VFPNVRYEDLTADQADILDDAARLIINARQRAGAMLADAGNVHADDPQFDGDPSRCQCKGLFDGGEPCPCTKYHGPRLCTTDIHPEGIPPHDSHDRCGHPASLHAPT
jgi:hypothetical protein